MLPLGIAAQYYVPPGRADGRPQQSVTFCSTRGATGVAGFVSPRAGESNTRLARNNNNLLSVLL